MVGSGGHDTNRGQLTGGLRLKTLLALLDANSKHKLKIKL